MLSGPDFNVYAKNLKCIIIQIQIQKLAKKIIKFAWWLQLGDCYWIIYVDLLS